MESSIYYQPQSGGLCRMHALNAFFKGPEISPAQFATLCAEFDKYILAKGYQWCQVTKFDCIYSSQETVISYIVGKYTRQYCVHLPMSRMPDYLRKKNMTLADLIGDDDDFIFVYNIGHVWGMRKVDDQWYKVDSMGGVRRDRLPTGKTLGVIIPRKCFQADLEWNQKQMRELQPISEYINTSFENSNMLGELEIILATTAHMIALDSGFKAVSKYFKFLAAYERNPDDKALCLANVPDLVDTMLEYEKKS